MATTLDPLLFISTPRVAVRRPSQQVFQRRRRVVGSVFAITAFTLASVFVSAGAFASNPDAAQQVVPRTVIAESGDTIWGIARSIVPEGSIADLVAELVRLNGTSIETGQIVRIP